MAYAKASRHAHTRARTYPLSLSYTFNVWLSVRVHVLCVYLQKNETIKYQRCKIQWTVWVFCMERAGFSCGYVTKIEAKQHELMYNSYYDKSSSEKRTLRRNMLLDNDNVGYLILFSSSSIFRRSTPYALLWIFSISFAVIHRHNVGNVCVIWVRLVSWLQFNRYEV